MAAAGSPGTNRSLALAAMIFAVAMTFIDQTIVSIAAPKIQEKLGLTSTGVQWAVNSYLLAMAALFALGGKLADTVGQRRMVTIGIVVFAAASALCGLTPKGSGAEAWIVGFRALQGAGGALMYPAALAIVVEAYPPERRGRALALFFGIAGGLTAVGPATGGYLVQWTWRSIFWINIPVAAIALVLVARSRPPSVRRPAPIDYRGLALVVLGVGLSVFGLQQSAQWGWSNPGTGLCIAAGVVLLYVLVRVELQTATPLINVRTFRDHLFLIDNVILLIAMTVFIPVFFFASEYAQISLGDNAAKASTTLLYFFIGFVAAAQIGGRALDRVGPKRPIVVGCALACAALILWAGKVTDLKMGPQVTWIILTGAGLGMMLGQVNTAALNRAPAGTYGEATGITQTVRNFGSSIGFAVLGTILVTVFRSDLGDSLVRQGVPTAAAHHTAGSIAQLKQGPLATTVQSIPPFVRADFASATQHVLYVMAGIMGFACLLALRALPRGQVAVPAVALEPAVA